MDELKLVDRLDPYRQITDPERPDKDYCEKVLSGHIPAGELLRLQCEHHLEDLEKGELRGLYYRPEKPLKFFYMCRDLKFLDEDGEHKRFRLFSWMIFAACLLDGWYRDATNPLSSKTEMVKRYRNGYIEAGRGGGKSYFIAARQLYHVASELIGGRSYLISSTYDTTKTAFMFLVGFIESNEILVQRFIRHGGFNPYQYTDTKHAGGIIRRRAAPQSKTKGSYGLNVSHLCVDEYHDMTNIDFVTAYETSFKATKNPQSMYITNAGKDLNTMCGQRTLEAARILRREVVDDTRFHLIYRVDETDVKTLYDIEGDSQEADEARLLILAKSCPAMPVTPNPSEILSLLRQAKEFPGDRPGFERLYLSQWVEGVAQWLSVEQVDKMLVKKLSPIELRRECPCFVGIDLSETDDFTSAVAVWAMPDGTIEAEARVWIPNGTLNARETKSGIPYSSWASADSVILTEGDLLDYSQLAIYLLETAQQPGFVGVVYDRLKIKNLNRDLFQAAGITLDNWRKPGCIWAISHSQTFLPGELQRKDDYKNDHRHMRLFFPRSISLTERAVRANKLKVLQNPALRVALRTAAIRNDGISEDNRKIVKSDSTAKIDPAVALVEAVGALQEWLTVTADLEEEVMTAEELKRQLEEQSSLVRQGLQEGRDVQEILH